MDKRLIGCSSRFSVVVFFFLVASAPPFSPLYGIEIIHKLVAFPATVIT